jgi:hypothetical protein
MARIPEIGRERNLEVGDMEGTDVVTYDEDKLGTVLEQRDDFVIIESGHVFKSKHAIPREFIHEQNGVLVATVAKDVVMDSPKVNGDALDAHEIRRHYGLDVPFEVDPDPERPAGAEELSNGDGPGVTGRDQTGSTR